MRTARTSGCSRGYTVRWTIRSSHAACDPESEVSTSGEEWETDAFDVSLSYWYRKLVRFTRRQLRADAILTLSVEFDEAWDYGHARPSDAERRAGSEGDVALVGSLGTACTKAGCALGA